MQFDSEKPDTRNRETFVQEGVKEGHVDLAGLRDALAASTTKVIDVHDIRESEQYGVFFRQENRAQTCGRKGVKAGRGSRSASTRSQTTFRVISNEEKLRWSTLSDCLCWRRLRA